MGWVYRDSLALVLLRASTTGRGILFTAQGGSTDSAVVQDFNSVEVFDVPELVSDEIAALCVERGCPIEFAPSWGTLVAAWTRGHPKLVQIRLAELAARDWPRPSATDLITPSSAETSARRLARRLLSESVPAPVAEFVYLASECSVPMHRSVAIRLAETVDGLTNAGDVVDNLAGKWLERLDGDRYRATALLNESAVEVWSPEKRKRAHVRLHDAIRAKPTVGLSEAAALLFHAYMGGEPRRLAHTALRLQLIEGNEARRQVERQLLWLPYIALDPGQSIAEDAMTGAILRSLQFRVASTLDTDGLPQICARWADDIERIPHPDARVANRALMWLSIGFAESPKVPLEFRLEAIAGVPTLPGEILEMHTDLVERFFEKNGDPAPGLPASGTTAQLMFLCANPSVRDLASLDELLQWLDNVAIDDIRQQCDAMLEWPLVQTLGAFVQGAWVAAHECTRDWGPWLSLFERVDEYARRRASPRFGREAAKAKAIVLTEYLGRDQEALTVLDSAEASFGTSTVLMEQRANVLFHTQDDESVLEIWRQLISDPVRKTLLNPFAYRWAGMSAARLKRWDEAEQIFRAGADSVQPGSFDLTKFGLRLDAALAISLGGNQAAAARLLAEAVLSLPAEAATEGDERWEAVQRAGVEVCRTIENHLWKPTEAEPKFEPGYSSSPVLKVSEPVPGQAVRSEMTRARILKLAATLLTDPPGLAQELEVLVRSRYFLVRWFATEARLALAYGGGAGTDFVEALLAFDAAMADLSVKPRARSPLEPDDGPEPNLPVAPERWFGLLTAGIVCTGPDLFAHLNIWLDASNRLLGKDAVLTNNIRLFLRGASLPAELLQSAAIDRASPAPVRCGAAAKLLLGALPATPTLQLQAFLASGLVSDASFGRQEIFNRHVARRFADAWRRLAQGRFQFSSPSTSVPALLVTLDAVEHGSGTLKSVLVAAASALRSPLGDFMERVA